ncbi:MAG: hypothetical protein HYU66_21055 [Armatimonadetes bacterium]|nr:hypothetical protein [Armatimonadota bacterium]
MGLMLPRDARPGVYRGQVTVKPANAPAATVPIELTVADRVAVEHGDNEPWKHSRLRWLDSTIALDDELTPPYTPLKLRSREIGCLGRTLRFGGDGLPAAIAAGTTELLAAPVEFAVTTTKGRVAWSAGKPRVTKQAPGAVEWTAERRADGLGLTTSARMEYDGHVTWRLTLHAEQAASLRDVALELPFRRDAVPYLMGIGRKGGCRPASHAWKWGGPVYYDSFWLGDVPAGVQCELRGASYCGPMVNLYWNLGQLKPPATWDNGGKGGVTVVDDGADRVLARAFSGPRELAAGESITFEFALLITPVKPLDTAAHFRTRYFHDYQPVDKIAATGANVINIHHANELNPYINYPFLAVDKLTAYVRAAHERDMKVKIYYTLRELTNHTVELAALRSLGHEVLAPGGGGGYPWLREHLSDDYAPAWFQPQPDGEACAAIVNSGTSRWYNYYLEGLGWLVRHAQIDGLYNDDVSYDRRIMKRVRKILDRNRPGCMIDLHSNTGFSHGPANQSCTPTRPSPTARRTSTWSSSPSSTAFGSARASTTTTRPTTG